MKNLQILPLLALVSLLLGVWAIIEFSQSHNVLPLTAGIALSVAAPLAIIAFLILRNLRVK